MIEFTVNLDAATSRPLVFDDSKCVGCNRCLEACQVDCMLPSAKGKHPIMAYPSECYYCGCCVMSCPCGAVKLQHPLMNQAKYIDRNELKNKKT